MSNNRRTACVVLGSLGFSASLGILQLCFFFAHYGNNPYHPAASRLGRVLEDVFTDPPLTAVTFLGLALMTFSLMLGVKGIANPLRFWLHTGRHLLIASGATLTFVLLALTAFLLLLG